MHILYIVPYVPNLIRVRPYNLIRQLAKNGHQVTVATLWTSQQERESLSDLEQLGIQVMGMPMPAWRSFLNCLVALPSGAPLQSVYSWYPDLARQMADLAVSSNGKAHIDVIQVEHLRGVRYGLFLKSQLDDSPSGIPIVWDSVDSISHLFRQAMIKSKSWLSRGMTRFELARTEAFEARMVTQFEHTLVTSRVDQEAFRSLPNTKTASRRISVLKNGVDLEYFTPDDSLERDTATVITSGKMSYHANVSMALRLVEEIMPLVWAVRPDVRVLIVGKDPPKQVQALAQPSRVVVTGTVEDMRPYLRQATLAASPVRYGAGIQNKVLEAMACGTPVITSSQAVKALEVKPGEDLLVADEPQTFSQAILGLLDDLERRKKIGKAGRAYVESQHRWSTIAGQLEGIYAREIELMRVNSDEML